MRRPEINETAEETVGRCITADAMQAWGDVCSYLSDLEAYADVLEQQLSQPAPQPHTVQALLDQRDQRIGELSQMLADAQARLRGIQILTIVVG